MRVPPNESLWALKWQALLELLSRYKTIWGFHWAHRFEKSHAGFSAEEAEFLPGSLAIQERPMSPLPRLAMWALMAFALIALVWSMLGKLEIVVVGHGQMVPSQRSKSIQAVELGSVLAIHVKDGSRVKAGDVLIELDATSNSADSKRLHSELHESVVQFMVNESLQSSLNLGKKVFDAQQLLALLTDRDSQRTLLLVPKIQEAQLLFEQRWGDLMLQEKKAAIEIDRRHAEMEALSETILKLKQVLPLARQRAQDLQELHRQGVVSRHQFLEREQVAIEAQAELAAQQSKLQELGFLRASARNELQWTKADMRRQAVQNSREQWVKAHAALSEMVKVDFKTRQQVLRAPIDGVVQQLAVHTLGGVVTSAQTLMVVVPQEDELEIEVKLDNKDMGFVKPRQPTVIKVDAFPYTRHGVLHGEVLHVSQDAVPSQDNKEFNYIARVRLAPNRDLGSALPLMAGMTTAVEINTGSRRVIDYFLSPLMEYTSEAMRER